MRTVVFVEGASDLVAVEALARYFARALERSGHDTAITQERMERLGFFVCDADLEDELIRSLGVDSVERIVAEQGDAGLFRTFQRQPAQRERSTGRQLRRFMGTIKGRKIHYAQALVDGLDLNRVPRPLERLITRI